MSATDRQAHWDNVYTTKGKVDVSWFQENPSPSSELIELVGATMRSAIIDVGGGASRLVDALIGKGYADVTVLDLSATARAAAQTRIGEKASRAHWLTADATTWAPSRTYDVWHDRAAFHFLTDRQDRAAYVARLRRALRSNGHVIIGAFAPDRPETCSGLPIARRDAATLAGTLGPGFALVETRRREHKTPRGSTQRFQFSAFRRIG